LLILDSDLRVKHTVSFRDAYPTALSGLDFNSTEQDTVLPQASATFKYSYWELDSVDADTATMTPADRQ
jgi:hypothetical protein